jgi:hypothetical protein
MIKSTVEIVHIIRPARLNDGSKSNFLAFAAVCELARKLAHRQISSTNNSIYQTCFELRCALLEILPVFYYLGSCIPSKSSRSNNLSATHSTTKKSCSPSDTSTINANTKIAILVRLSPIFSFSGPKKCEWLHNFLIRLCRSVVTHDGSTPSLVTTNNQFNSYLSNQVD